MIATSIDNLGDAVEVLAVTPRPGWSYSIHHGGLTPHRETVEAARARLALGSIHRPELIERGRAASHTHCRQRRRRAGA